MVSADPPKFGVRLLGDDDDDVSDVHWVKMRRLAGPDYVPTEEVVASALHDRQKFKVDYFVDWMVDDEGDVAVYVHWKHHTNDERTWEPLLQLCEDVPARIAKYVEDEDIDVQTTAHDDCLAQLAAAGDGDDDE